MASKHKKRCSTSFAISEMQIKTTVRAHTHTKVVIIKKTENKFWQECGEIVILVHCWLKYKMDSHSSKKLNIQLLYEPAIPLVGIYPKELKAGFKQLLIYPCSY